MSLQALAREMATLYYLHLIELFISFIQKTEVVQLLDLMSQPMGQAADLDRFTLLRYQQIVKYKTAYYWSTHFTSPWPLT